jgi:hypothetical protein
MEMVSRAYIKLTRTPPSANEGPETAKLTRELWPLFPGLDLALDEIFVETGEVD